ncbi:ribosome-releasing factor 2, mitochondrial-like [Tubulanus polymorphus]|uniref:ribosome-releasing factor 2, mitochondrial-like n=1 Tax=Tubulanus polymorphus TaxID=672921 RepID=UPI003DA2FA17
MLESIVSCNKLLMKQSSLFRSMSNPCWMRKVKIHSFNQTDSDDIKRIRNIGIMAHIDGGKTTTTERMLYYSGLTQQLGDVDDGDTVTDYMEQERNRGITITSAAVTFLWNKYKINLIDTPGHVDFTVEVERALRVLDGAVTILDASAGVEAQTLTVWRQADRYNIPRIVYLNKMDKFRANFNLCLDSIEDKLKVETLPLQIPIGVEKSFVGLVDLVTMQKFQWKRDSVKDDGSVYLKKELSQSDGDIWEEAHEARNALIEKLADLDENIADLVLKDVKYEDIAKLDIYQALRRVTASRSAVPVLCGSSLKNIGVQPLLNAITWFLPNPNEVKHNFLKYYRDNFCAMAFKIIHDKQRGPLTFLRVYSGRIKSGANIYNINRDCSEKTTRLCQAQADDFKDISQASAGNIIVVTGLKQTVTGDTIVSSQNVASMAKKEALKDNLSDTSSDSSDSSHSEEDSDSEDSDHDFLPILATMDIPAPVFFRAIEPPSLSQQKQLEHALQCLQREDPSFTVTNDTESGQTIIGGMGELHLEIIQDRIRSEYRVEADLGPLMISYREALVDEVSQSLTIDKTIGEKHHRVSLKMSVHPSEGVGVTKSIRLIHTKDNQLDDIKRHHLKAIEAGMRSGLSQGPKLSAQVIDAEVRLHEFSYSYGTSLAIISACAAECIQRALGQSDSVLLQPMMKIEVNTDEDRLHTVLGDLAQRRGQILNIQARHDVRSINAIVRLEEMMGYSTVLRTITSGTATFSMHLDSYAPMSALEQKTVIQKLTGYIE